MIPVILRALSSDRVLSLAKAPISRALKLNANLSNKSWLNSLSTHLSKYPLSYATVASAIGAVAPDAAVEIYDQLGYADKEELKRILGKKLSIPEEQLRGGDDDTDTVWGVDNSDFDTNLEMINKARKTVEELAFRLGVSPETAIEIGLLAQAMEPNFLKIYKD